MGTLPLHAARMPHAALTCNLQVSIRCVHACFSDLCGISGWLLHAWRLGERRVLGQNSVPGANCPGVQTILLMGTACTTGELETGYVCQRLTWPVVARRPAWAYAPWQRISSGAGADGAAAARAHARLRTVGCSPRRQRPSPEGNALRHRPRLPCAARRHRGCWLQPAAASVRALLEDSPCPRCWVLGCCACSLERRSPAPCCWRHALSKQQPLCVW